MSKAIQLRPSDRPFLAKTSALEVISGRTMIATATGKLLSFALETNPDAPNPVSEATLCLADGTRTISQMGEIISTRFQVPVDVATTDLVKFFETLVAEGAFECQSRQ